MSTTESDLAANDLRELKDVTDIVEIVNSHTDEDALIHAVLDKLLDYQMAATVVFRRLSADGDSLVPVSSVVGGSKLDELLQTTAVPLDSFEGHAIREDHVVLIDIETFPHIKLDRTYRELVLHCAENGCRGALFYPVRSSEALGTLTFYALEDISLDERGLDMFHRAAKLMAFGIEKCRRIASKQHVEEDLRLANVRLESSNRDLQDFAHVASHDLQEPLRKIRTFSDRLNGSAADRLSDQSADDLDKIQAAAVRMQTLIDDLLVYSRVGNRIGDMVALGLNAVVEEAMVERRADLRRLNGTFEVEDLPAAMVDQRQMVQFFSALISNAVKFASPDRPLHVRISGKLEDGWVSIDVEDNGIGFEDKHAERIFEPFRRLHSRAEYEGTGMGLAVAKRIATRHHGAVRARSELGVGSTFTLLFPAT